MQMVTYREGKMEDSYNLFCITEAAVADLVRRFNYGDPGQWDEPKKLANKWQSRRPLYEHLAQTADQFWVAELEGELIGYARSVVRGQVQQLTEFFMKPEAQSGGAGRGLLQKAFPRGQTRYRSIIATMDIRAQARYLKEGVFPRFPLYYFGKEPEPRPLDPTLTIEPIVKSPEMLDVLAEVDTAVLSFRRDADHLWFSSQREGYLYKRDGRVLGYGYVSAVNGPFVLLDAADYPAVLAHAETVSATAGSAHFGLELPMCNETAVTYLLNNGFRMDSFVALFMCNQPFAKLENVIVMSPPFIL